MARNVCVAAGLDEEGRTAPGGLTISRRRVAKGQKLYREGDPFRFLYAIRVGTFKSGLSLDDGHEQVMSFCLRGDVMGFDGVADGTHQTTATALDHAEVCAIPYAQLMEACAESKPLRGRVTQLMAMELVREYRSVKMVAKRGAEQRVAGFLLEIAGWMKERGYSQHEFQLRMSRADIGSYLDTTLETVSRTLSLFARLGFITVNSRHIELLRPDDLLACVDRRDLPRGLCSAEQHEMTKASITRETALDA